MKILLIDNYDSFTYNLYHYISNLKKNVDVVRNDKINSKTILRKKYNKIVISPGPGEIMILSYFLLIIILEFILSFLITSMFFLNLDI